jgi:hypothetical protein
MNVEDMALSEFLPVNTLAVLKRFEEIVKEGRTNSLYSGKHREDPELQLKVRKIFWLLANMMLYVIPRHEKSRKYLFEFVSREWDRLYRLEEARKREEEAVKLLSYF